MHETDVILLLLYSRIELATPTQTNDNPWYVYLFDY